MSLNPNRTTTDFEFNHEGQPDAYGPSVGDFTIVQQKFDSRAVDNLTDINQLKDTLRSISVGDSGAHNVGHKSLSLTAENVAEALEENRLIINSLSTADGQNVKITGNQTIAGIKTFSSSPIVPTPSSSTQAANKSYVDGKDSAQTAALTAHKASADHDGRYYTETEVDAFAVKLTGNQSIAGIKTFTSSPVIPAPTTDLQAATKKYVDDKAPLTILDNSVTDAKLVDVGGVKSAVYDSQAINLVEAYGYTKLADDGQDVSLWSGAGVVADTVNKKIGNQSLKFTSINGLAISVSNNLPTMNFDKLNNGESFISTDFVVSEVSADDESLITDVRLQLSSSATFDTGNYSQLIYPIDTNGFKQYFKTKSDITNVGAGVDFTDVKSMRFVINGTGVTNVNLQLIQLVKADPSGLYPNPLASQGYSIFSAEWFVGYEYGKLCLKRLGASAIAFGALRNDKQFKDFTLAVSSEILNTGYDLYGAEWYSDVNNRIRAYVNAGTLNFDVIEGGVPTTYSEAISLPKGSIARYIIEKNGNDVMFSFISDGISIQKTMQTTLTLSGVLALSASPLVGGINKKLSASITQLPHAGTCNLAEQAKSLTEQAKLKMYNTSAQSIPTDITSFTQVEFNSIEHSVGSMEDLVSSSAVIRQSGYYNLKAIVTFAANATGVRGGAFYKNGVYIQGTTNRYGALATAGVVHGFEVNGLDIKLNSGDIITLRIQQNSGGALNTIANETRMSISKIG